MTLKTTAFRSKPQNVEFHTPNKFGTTHAYHSDDRTNAVESERYFANCAHLLARGDEIRVTCLRDDGTWDKAMFEVCHSDRLAGIVQVERYTEWRHGGVQIMRNIKPVHKGGGRWNIEDDRRRVVAENLGKEEAIAFCESRSGKPEAAAESQAA